MVTLDLSLRDLDDDALADALARAPVGAERVSVARNTLGPRAWEALQHLLPHTRALHLGRTGLTEGLSARVAHCLRALPELRALSLAGNTLPPEAHHALSAASGSLRVLDLTATGLTEAALARWCDALAGSPLEALALGGVEVGPWATEALSRLPGLRALDLSCASLDDPGARALAVALPRATALSWLAVRASGLAAGGVRALLEGSRGHPSLRVLDLGDHPARAHLGGQENRTDPLAQVLAAVLPHGHLRALALPEGALEQHPGVVLAALTEGATLTSLRGSRQWPVASERALQAVLCAHASREPRAPKNPFNTLGAPPQAALWTHPERSRPELGPLGFTASDLAAAEKVLEALSLQPPQVQQRFNEVRSLAARMLRPRRAKTPARRPLTVPHTHLHSPTFTQEPVTAPTAVQTPTRPYKRCYVCKIPYTELHHHYHQHCPPCAALHWEKRHQTADLTGRVAVVTGARVKVGFAAALGLLRAGCVVHGLTRFPRDAADRYAREPDFHSWRERLVLHGLDLRNLPAVERFAVDLGDALVHLDVVIHNAAQTVQRPEGFHARELAREAAPDPEDLRGLVRTERALAVAPVPDTALFPPGSDDGFGQPVDLRPRTSWNLPLEEVSTRELVEVQVINVLAPYVLTARWKPALLRSPFPDRYVVNVSAVEGQFSRGYRSGKHPHTNMAKAALNMLTLTAAPALSREGIYLTAVDTGWVSDQNPWWVTERTARGKFRLPLDLKDAAARVLDPVFRGVSRGDRAFGVFLKDYLPSPW